VSTEVGHHVLAAAKVCCMVLLVVHEPQGVSEDMRGGLHPSPWLCGVQPYFLQEGFLCHQYC